VVQGGRVPEFQVTPDPARLPASGVTVADILDALRRTNLIDSPGLIESDHHLVLALVSGQVHTAEQIGNIVVKTSAAGIPIRIGDVATVARSVAPTYTIVTANGKPAVLLNINRQPDSNTLQVANEAHDLIQAVKPSLPPGVRLEPFYDQSTIVHDSISSVRDSVLLGIVLSSVVLVLFLRDWGTSLVAGLVIPVTLLITFVALRTAGQSFNLMTLGGLAAAVGLVIDDAIVVLENIVLHRDAGQDRFRAIQSAARTDSPIDRIHDHSRCRILAADRDHGRDRKLLPRLGCYDDGRFAYFTSAGAYLDSYAESVSRPARGSCGW
jgi:multidrug efflux pump subunit AcrB